MHHPIFSVFRLLFICLLKPPTHPQSAFSINVRINRKKHPLKIVRIMGRSKFPGKPSKLVNKKRVSVLNNTVPGHSGSSDGNCSSPDQLLGNEPPHPDDDSDYADGSPSSARPNSQDRSRSSVESSSSSSSCSADTSTKNTTTTTSTNNSNNSSSSSSSGSRTAAKEAPASSNRVSFYFFIFYYAQ